VLISNGTTTANAHGGGTITAAGISVGRTLLNVPDSVFADPDYKHLSFSDVMVFVKAHAHLPWTTGRAKRGTIDLSQRFNEVLESVENMWLYVQQLFEHDKAHYQRIDKLEKEIQQLKLQCAGK